ncbi:MAG: ROK family protein [Patescibacteria group bacterium]|nr:ROK family protein [Patescibacteria group bacterium]
MDLLFDIGGTKTRIGLAKNKKIVGRPTVVATTLNFKDAIKEFSQIKNQIIGRTEKVSRLVVAIAGILNKQKDMLIRSPHLQNWQGQPLKRELEKIFKAKTYLENDAALAGLAEARAGKIKNKKNIAYLNFGTGVGGVRIVDGKIDRASVGFEPGHQFLIFSSKSGNHFNLFEIEDFLAGWAIEKKFGRRSKLIQSKSFWSDLTKVLAVFVYNLDLVWSVDAVILGGSLAEKIDLDKLKNQLVKINKILPRLPLIKKSKFGDLSGLYGGLVYLNQLKK